MKTHFNMKGYEPRLTLKKRYKATRKWPIAGCEIIHAGQEAELGSGSLYITLQWMLNNSILTSSGLLIMVAMEMYRI